MTFYQLFLPIFTVVYFLQLFVIWSWIQWKRTGINPFVFGKSDNAHDFIGLVFKITILGIVVSISCFSFLPGHYKYLLPIWYLELEYLKITGIGLTLLSFGWIVLAQFQMSKSWRIGINQEEKTTLVSTGVFGYSRNPIFLGVIITYFGSFLIMPNALSFAIMLITYFILQIQVRLEEEYLLRIHDKDYEQYKSKVRRWL